jgi:hypothetical protein
MMQSVDISRQEDPTLIWKTTPVGFEPTRGDPIGLAGRRLNRSASVLDGPTLEQAPHSHLGFLAHVARVPHI